MPSDRTTLPLLACLFCATCGGGSEGSAADAVLGAAPSPLAVSAEAQALASAGPGCPAPDWVPGRPYAAGSVVTYAGALYFARYANPGYNPVISTYFWVPHPCVPPPAPASCVYPPWVEGYAYKSGDIVLYAGKLYVASFDNPGYVPTISTYFWAPTTCTAAPAPAPSPAPSPSPAPAPAPAPGQPFSLESQGETRYLVMNWWRGDPAIEGDFRRAGICTGPAPAGNCTLGARKTFRPQGFSLQNGLLWLEVPQYAGGANTYDHYPLPVEAIKDPVACKFSLRHVRTHGALEFPLNPPGLEILPHAFTMTAALCSTFNPSDPAWVQALNAELDRYLGPDPAPYTPDPYPYGDPRTGADPSV